MVLILGDGIRFIDISTHVIAFRRDGGLRRPPIIFLHTLGGDMMQWVVSDVYKDLVGRGLEVYAVDLDGHGFSGRNPYDEEFMKIERLASSIASFVERAGVEKPVLVGISLGGSVAILARALLKEKAIGALALAPMVRGDPDRFSKLASLWEKVSDPGEAIEIIFNSIVDHPDLSHGLAPGLASCPLPLSPLGDSGIWLLAPIYDHPGAWLPCLTASSSSYSASIKAYKH